MTRRCGRWRGLIALPGIGVAIALAIMSAFGATNARGQTAPTPQNIHGLGSVQLPPGGVVVFDFLPSQPAPGATPVRGVQNSVTVESQSDQAVAVSLAADLEVVAAQGTALELVPPSPYCWFGMDPSADLAPANVLTCQVRTAAGVGLLAFTTATVDPAIQLANRVQYPTGWNLIAGPTTTVTAAAVGPLYTLVAGDMGYEEFIAGASLQQGVGYWAYFAHPVAQRLAAAGRKSIAIVVPPGQFVLVGNPGQTPVAIDGADFAYVYDPSSGYVTADHLQPGQGAWVYSMSGATVNLR